MKFFYPGLSSSGGNPLLQQLPVGFSNDNFQSLGVSSSTSNFSSTKSMASFSSQPTQTTGQTQQQRLQAEKLRQSELFWTNPFSHDELTFVQTRDITSFSASAGNDITAVLPGVNQSFSSEVESEANSYFQKIYNQPPNPTMTIDEVLEMLKKFKDSSSKKEKASCVEIRFPPSIRFLLLCDDPLNRRCFFVCYGICSKNMVTFIIILTENCIRPLASLVVSLIKALLRK